MPDFTIEAQFAGRVAGIDEAGRGPLAGPVVAACVVFTRPVPPQVTCLLDDSKKLSAAQRQDAYSALRACAGVEIGIGAASVADIGRINILQASLLAMARAVRQLNRVPDIALVDGNRAPQLACPVHCIIGGDGRSLSIAAASIVAKIIRDRAMARLGARYPSYGWAENAGYGTQHHRNALHRYGVSQHHRAAFGTVREILGLT